VTAELLTDHRRRLGVLIMSEEKAKELGYTPRARFHTFAWRASTGHDADRTDPGDQEGPRASGPDAGGHRLIEINEAFASVVLAWQKELGVDLSKVNVNAARSRWSPARASARNCAPRW